MPRTFSLYLLMLGITAFCIFCGLAVNFPHEMLLFVAFSVPTAIVWLTIIVAFRDNVLATSAACFTAACSLLMIVFDPLSPLIAALVVCVPFLFLKRFIAR
jgi:hypothetical protein